ncbi:hypothetical protein HK102_002010 [Quaeritorhiza haematococci]|nr:hypothetical protein HK102_002010 [Quaeritorhiza haematococci]
MGKKRKRQTTDETGTGVNDAQTQEPAASNTTKKNGKRPAKKVKTAIEKDTPRKFRRLMQYAEKLKKKEEDAKNQSKKQKEEKSNDGKRNAPQNGKLKIERKPGELFSDFSRRVDEAHRSSINAAAAETTKTRQKRKAWLDARKKQKKGKTGKKDGDEEELGDESPKNVGQPGGGAKQISQQQIKKVVGERVVEHVPFGQVVQAPPTISVVPRNSKESKITKKGSRWLTTEAAQKQLNSGSSESSVVGRKKKLKTLSAAEQRQLLTERDRIIASYRLAKSRQLALKSSFGQSKVAEDS